MSATSPTVTVACTNKDCERYEKPVLVHLTHLGQDVYAMTGLVCGACWPGPHGLVEMQTVDEGLHDG